jgi:hypothetical protein
LGKVEGCGQWTEFGQDRIEKIEEINIKHGISNFQVSERE